MRGDGLVAGPAGVQQPRGLAVEAGALAGRERAEHRVAHERMRELQRPRVAQDARVHEPLRVRRGVRGARPARRAAVASGAASSTATARGEALRAGSEPGDRRAHRARQRLGPDARATSAAGSPAFSPSPSARRRTSSGFPPVAAWQAAARSSGPAPSPLRDQRRGAGERERARLDQASGRGRRGAARALRGQQQHRQVVEPVGEEGEEAGRRLVRPVLVVDDEQLRALRGEVGHQPVEAVERAERRVGLARGVRALGQEHGRGQRGGAAERALERRGAHPPQPRLEQLPRHAPGVGGLELAAARRRDREAALRRGRARGVEQARLADAGRPLDDDDAAAAGDRVAERRVEDGELGVTLVQPQHHGCGRL